MSADLTVPPPMPPLDNLERYLSDKLKRCEDLMRHVPEMREPIELREWLAALASLRADNANLRTVMVAAAEEIQAHWAAHCDADGCGPANLMRRLEEGIPSEYGYTAGAFAALSERIASLLRAAPPLPVVAYIEHHKAGDNLLFDHPGGKHTELTSKADADAAIASLQARLDAAERSKAELLEALTGAVKRCQRFHYVGSDGQYIKVMRAAIDAATQEKP